MLLAQDQLDRSNKLFDYLGLDAPNRHVDLRSETARCEREVGGHFVVTDDREETAVAFLAAMVGTGRPPAPSTNRCSLIKAGSPGQPPRDAPLGKPISHPERRILEQDPIMVSPSVGSELNHTSATGPSRQTIATGATQQFGFYKWRADQRIERLQRLGLSDSHGGEPGSSRWEWPTGWRAFCPLQTASWSTRWRTLYQ